MTKEISRYSRVTYVCTGCGSSNCRLWRQYQTFADQTELLCCECAEKDQSKTCQLPDGNDPHHKTMVLDKGSGFERPATSTIGWLVPAIPTADWETFWGYTSVPPDGIKWWYDMPLRPKQK